VESQHSEDALPGSDWWPVHPLDFQEGDPAVWHGIYMGAAGVVWALDHLARAGLHEPRLDYARPADEVLESYLSRPEFDGPLSSAWNGEGGIAFARVAVGADGGVRRPSGGASRRSG
jgi:hypothetical protein